MYQDLKDHFLNQSQSFWKTLSLCLLACLGLTGCGDKERIRIYTAPKEKAIAGPSTAEPTEPKELLGALIPKERSPWAFKMMGSPEQVSQYREQFRELVDSFSFSSDGTPVWKLPADWREEAGNEFTYRTFRPPNESTLKATISELSYSSSAKDLNVSKWQQYVLENVNRWRGQLSLENQVWDEMAGDLQTIDKLSMRDLPAYYVSLRGEGSSQSMGGPMMSAGGAGPFAAAAPAGPPANIPSKSKLEATAPEGIREVAPLSVMAWKSYEAMDGGYQSSDYFHARWW